MLEYQTLSNYVAVFEIESSSSFTTLEDHMSTSSGALTPGKSKPLAITCFVDEQSNRRAACKAVCFHRPSAALDNRHKP